MKFYNLMSYNAEIKIAGDVITLKTYDKKQVWNYVATNKSLDKNIYEKAINIYNEMIEGFINYRKGINDKIKYYIFGMIFEEKKRERFVKSCYRASTMIFDLIACNVDKHLDFNNKKQRVKFLTLTFKDNVNEIELANKEITKFFKRLSYSIYKVNKNVIKYLVVPELQTRGAWHYHIVIFNMPYVQFVDLKRIWGLGGVYINALKGKLDGTTVAKYVTKYIAKGINIKENEINTSINQNEDNEGTKRLSDYDLYKKNGMENKKRYFTSRGLKKPFKSKIMLNNAEIGTIVNYLVEYAKKEEKEGQAIKKIHYAEYNNEFRGDVKVVSVEVNKEFMKNDFKRFIWGIVKYEKKICSKKMKINWGLLDAIRRKSKEDIAIYELEKKWEMMQGE